jgi:hypothetical protein
MFSLEVSNMANEPRQAKPATRRKKAGRHQRQRLKAEPEFVSLRSRPLMLPDEDPADYTALQEALHRELRPSSPYQASLVDNLARLEWEARRHSRIRDAAIIANFKEKVAEFVHRHMGGQSILPTPEVRAHVAQIFGTDEGLRREAVDSFKKDGVDVTEVLAKCHMELAEALAVHEERLAEIEWRRRRLREDFDALKPTRQRAFVEAEVIEG